MQERCDTAWQGFSEIDNLIDKLGKLCPGLVETSSIKKPEDQDDVDMEEEMDEGEVGPTLPTHPENKCKAKSNPTSDL